MGAGGGQEDSPVYSTPGHAPWRRVYAGRSSGSGSSEYCHLPGFLQWCLGSSSPLQRRDRVGLHTQLPCPAYTTYSVVVPYGTLVIVIRWSTVVNGKTKIHSVPFGFPFGSPFGWVSVVVAQQAGDALCLVYLIYGISHHIRDQSMVNAAYLKTHSIVETFGCWYNRYKMSDYLTSCKNWHDSCEYIYRRLSVRIS